MADRASRPWRRATAIAVAVHAILFALAVQSVKIARPPAEPRAVDLQLVQVQPLALRREPPPKARSAPASAPPSSAPVSAAPAPSTATAAAPEGPPQPSAP